MKVVDQSVELLDSMGSDLSIVNAARVSFAKESDWEAVHEPIPLEFGLIQVRREGALYNYEKGEVRLSEKDQKLIKYLAEHNHWTPFGHAFLTYRIKAPIFVARQLVKHQVGLVWNEVSRRYVDDEPEFYIPRVWRKKAENVKQGSSDEEIIFLKKSEYYPFTVSIKDLLEEVNVRQVSLYYDLLDAGVAPEQARMVLPQSMMTTWIWSGSLAAFARVCKLRLDPHAQKETQEVAQMISNQVPKEFEHSWKALLG